MKGEEYEMYRYRLHKSIIASFFVLITIASVVSLYIPKPVAAGEEIVVIPNEAIRLRILANSNSDEDQEIKRMIRDQVNEQITEWVSELTNLEDAREIITGNLDELEKIALHVMEEHGAQNSLDVDFGRVDFPTKLYGNFLYPAGSYEAILITIGEGVGANWWCVLFPPLCFLDFSSGSAVSDGFEDKAPAENKAEDTDHIENVSNDKKQSDKEEKPIYAEDQEEEVEVKFFLFELIDRILSIFK